MVSVSVKTLPDTAVHCGVEMLACTLTAHSVLLQNLLKLLIIRQFIDSKFQTYVIKGVLLIYLVSLNPRWKLNDSFIAKWWSIWKEHPSHGLYMYTESCAHLVYYSCLCGKFMGVDVVNSWVSTLLWCLKQVVSPRHKILALKYWE